MAEVAKKKGRIRKRVLLAIPVCYLIANSIGPVLFGTVQKSRNYESKVPSLNEIAKENNIPEEHLEGMIALEVNEDRFFVSNMVEPNWCYSPGARIIFVPDYRFHHKPEFSNEDFAHEIGHHAYLNFLTKKQRKRVEEYTLRLLKGIFETLREARNLRKEIRRAGESGEIEKAFRMEGKLIVLNYGLEIGYNKDANVGVSEVSYVYDPNEVFARLYSQYFAVKEELWVSSLCRNIRIIQNADKPPLEDLLDEGMRMMKEMFPDRGGIDSNPQCVLIKAQLLDITYIKNVWPRYLDPSCIIRSLTDRARESQFNKKIKKMEKEYRESNPFAKDKYKGDFSSMERPNYNYQLASRGNYRHQHR